MEIYRNEMGRDRSNGNEELFLQLAAESQQISGGRLYIRHRDGRINFIEYIDGKHYGITRNMDRVYQLARRDYIQCRLECMKAKEGTSSMKIGELQMREAKAELSLRKLLSKFQLAKLDLKRIVMTKAQYEWQKHPQSRQAGISRRYAASKVFETGLSYEAGNHPAEDYRAESRCFITKGGVFVRSELEQWLGSIMEELNIPYKYEPKVLVSDREYIPKFAVMQESGNIVLLECLEDDGTEQSAAKTAELIFSYGAKGMRLGREWFLAMANDLKVQSAAVDFLQAVMEAKPEDTVILAEGEDRRNRRQVLH